PARLGSPEPAVLLGRLDRLRPGLRRLCLTQNLDGTIPGLRHLDSPPARRLAPAAGRRAPAGALPARHAARKAVSVKVLHLSTFDIRGGAARGAYWLHQAL